MSLSLCLSVCLFSQGQGGEGEGEEGAEEKDVYDTMLTQTEIQDGVDSVNTTVKKEEAEAKRESGPAATEVFNNNFALILFSSFFLVFLSPSLSPSLSLSLSPPSPFPSSAQCGTGSQRGHHVWWQDSSAAQPAVRGRSILTHQPPESAVVRRHPGQGSQGQGRCGGEWT